MFPKIDLSQFINGSAAEKQAIANEIGDACTSMGFIYVYNHGIAQSLIDETREAMEAFFALPYESKMPYERPKGHYRGYIPVSGFTETADGRPPVNYEAFLVGHDVTEADPAISASHGLLIPNIWPDEPSGFRHTVETYWHGVEQIGLHLHRAFSLALGCEDENRINQMFTRPLSNISLLHYLPRPDTDSQDPDDARAHHDTNVLTILLPGEVGGLEAQKPDGTWIEVPPLRDCFVVNIGNMMSCWSGGRFKSTMHRVHPPLGVDRYSIAYFTVPDYDTIVTPLNPELIVHPEFSSPIHAGENLAAFVASCDEMDQVYG